MELRPEQLATQAASQPLAPVYLVAGPELLRVIEAADAVRAKVLAYLDFMGLNVDEEANRAARFGQSGIISQPGCQPLAMVVPTNEELMIAQDTAALAGIA